MSVIKSYKKFRTLGQDLQQYAYAYELRGQRCGPTTNFAPQSVKLLAQLFAYLMFASLITSEASKLNFSGKLSLYTVHCTQCTLHTVHYTV